METYPEGPFPLTPTRNGLIPQAGTVGSFEGLVAGWGFSSDSIITSPNRPWIPRFAIAHSEITTYTDGRWGYHEYSRWPQVFDRGHIHCACIPRSSSSLLVPDHDVLWRTWYTDDWVCQDCPIVRLGRLNTQVVDDLDAAAESIGRLTDDVCTDPAHRRIRDFLVICLHQTAVIISLAAHAQRLTLELCGLYVFVVIVHARLAHQQDHRTDILDVVGALTHDPSVAQTLHRVGIPVWFQQRFSSDIVFWHAPRPTLLPLQFSSTPSFPRLVLAVRDLSGALNTPGESMRAMAATVRRQLLVSSLPPLLSDSQECDSAPTSKRARLETQWPNKWDSALGHAQPVLVVRNARETKALGHGLEPVGPARPMGQRRARAVVAGKAKGQSTFVMNPFRQHYPSADLLHSPAWSAALFSVSPLPQPRSSVRYFFPPPWLIDILVGYDTPQEKRVRYVHNMLSIRMFCRVRLLDSSFAGRPLTVHEWRDALWGDYELEEGPGLSRDGSKPPARLRDQQSIRELFGRGAALASYDPTASYTLDGRQFTAQDAASDDDLRRRLVWEAHEANWRCDLLALDAIMTGSNAWDEMKRWVRKAHVSEVWGPSRSGLNICPDPGDSAGRFQWYSPTDEPWEQCRPALRAFVDLLCTWPGSPRALKRYAKVLATCEADEFERAQHEVLAYYVAVFVEKFQRLPIPPVRDPRIDRQAELGVRPPTTDLRTGAPQR